MPRRVRKRLRIGPAELEPPAGARNRKKHPLNLFPIILYPALNQKVHLIQILYLNFLEFFP